MTYKQTIINTVRQHLAVGSPINYAEVVKQSWYSDLGQYLFEGDSLADTLADLIAEDYSAQEGAAFLAWAESAINLKLNKADSQAVKSEGDITLSDDFAKKVAKLRDKEKSILLVYTLNHIIEVAIADQQYKDGSIAAIRDQAQVLRRDMFIAGLPNIEAIFALKRLVAMSDSQIRELASLMD